MKRGDLVLTPDGYYGIYLEGTDVFLGNGCRQVMDKEEFDRCIKIPMRHGDTRATSNFNEILLPDDIL